MFNLLNKLRNTCKCQATLQAKNCRNQGKFKYGWYNIEHHGRQYKIDRTGASINGLKIKTYVNNNSDTEFYIKCCSLQLFSYITLERAPVCFERWKFKSKLWICVKTLQASFLIECWATLAKTAFRNSFNPAAPDLAMPSLKINNLSNIR